VPTTLSPDGRDRPPHLRSFHDGWRHLRFLLIYSPQWLFLFPGLFLILLSGSAGTALFFGRIDIGIRYFDFHSFILTGAMLMLGINMLSFAGITRVFAYNFKLLPERPAFFRLFKYINLEVGLGVGFVSILCGLLLIAYAASLSVSPGFESLGFNRSIRLVFGGSLFLATGGQIILTSFVLSMLGLNPRE
jgi:hypothetical protein